MTESCGVFVGFEELVWRYLLVKFRIWLGRVLPLVHAVFSALLFFVFLLLQRFLSIFLFLCFFFNHFDLEFLFGSQHPFICLDSVQLVF